MANQDKERPDEKPAAPPPAAPTDNEEQPDENAEAVHGIPPGVSVDTPAGRRAQGMVPDIGKGRPPEREGQRDDDEKEPNKEGEEKESSSSS